MTRDYSDQEQLDAVTKIIRSEVRRPYGGFGNRKTDITFSDTQDAAAGVFILYPKAPYYVAKISASILQGKAEDLITEFEELGDSIRATSRKINSTAGVSSLANARAALGALEGAISERDDGLIVGENIPALQRFDQATSRFLSEHGKAISSGGHIVQTPEEARERIKALAYSVIENYENVGIKAAFLSDAINDFDSLALLSRLSSNVIRNSKNVLSSRYDELVDKTSEEKLKILREVVLDVLATRAAVKGFVGVSPAQTFSYFPGIGELHSSATYSAEPASVIAEIPGPYALMGDGLSIDTQGTNITVSLPLSYVASLDGFIPEPFNINPADIPPDIFQNDRFILSMDGHPDLEIVLSDGVLRTSPDIAAEIMGQVGARPIVAEAYCMQERTTNPVNLINAGGPLVQVENVSGDWSDLYSQPQVGDWVLLSGSVGINDGWYQIMDIMSMPAFFVMAKEAGAPADEDGLLATIGTANRGLRLRFSDSFAKVSVETRQGFGIPNSTTGVYAQTVGNLGFINGAVVQSAPTMARDCVNFIRQMPDIAPNGNLLLEPSVASSTLFETAVARIDPADPTKLILSRLSAVCAVADTVFGDTVFSGLDPAGAGIQLGDIVAIRSAVINTVLNYGSIIAIGTDFFTAVMTLPMATETDISIEIGPDFTFERLPLAVVIANTPPSVNDGNYLGMFVGGVDGLGIPFELGLDRPLISPADVGARPWTLSARVDQEYLQLTATDTSLGTSITIQNSGAAPEFWNNLPLTELGSSQYFRLSTTAGVEVGDILELKDAPAQAVTHVQEIIAVHSNPPIIQVATGFVTDLGSYGMFESAPAPSGRIRRARRHTFDALHNSLVAWRRSNPTTAALFGELRRVLNPLLANTSPRVSDISDASNLVLRIISGLRQLITELEQYDAPEVEEVDALLDAYQQQGAQRAIDILLECQFREFFGLSQDEVSYTGVVQKRIREVNTYDLPRSKTQDSSGILLDSYEEPDFEFDVSDTEGGEEDISPPGEAYDYKGNSAF